MTMRLVVGNMQNVVKGMDQAMKFMDVGKVNKTLLCTVTWGIPSYVYRVLT